MKIVDEILIVQVEDDSYDGKDFKKVFSAEGETYNIKSGRGGALREKWPLLEIGTVIKPEWGEFNGKAYIKDFTVLRENQEVNKDITQKATAFAKGGQADDHVRAYIIRDLQLGDKATERQIKKLETWTLELGTAETEAPPVITKERIQETAEGEPDKPDTPKMDNLGSFYQSCLNAFNRTKSQVDADLAEDPDMKHDLSTEKGRMTAFVYLSKKYLE